MIQSCADPGSRATRDPDDAGTGRWLLFTGAALLTAVLAGPRPAGAQGFSLWEQGNCALGRGGAAVAAPCGDGSAVFFNPAGIVGGGTDWTLTAGGHGIAAIGEFTADRTGNETELANDVVSVPHLYARRGIDDRLAAAVGVYAPYGLETRWPRDFSGAFLGFDDVLRTVYIQPTVAYRPLEWLSVGGGLTVAVGTVELNRLLDLADRPLPESRAPFSGATFGQIGIPPETSFARASLDADGATGIGGHFGLLARVHHRVRIGVRYLTRVNLDFDGDAGFSSVSTGITLPPENPFGVPGGTPLDRLLESAGLFEPGGPLSDQGVATEIEMPDQLVAGIAFEATDRLLLEGDWTWMNWSVFDRISIDFENPATPDETLVQEFDDTHGIRVGGEYALDGEWTVRGGYAYNGAASPDRTVTPLLPEADRNQFTAGLGWRIAPGLDVDASYIFLAQNDRRGRIREPREGESPSDFNTGLYGFAAHLFGATFTLRF